MKKQPTKFMALLLAVMMTMSTTCFASESNQVTMKQVHSESGLRHHSYGSSEQTATVSSQSSNDYFLLAEDSSVSYDYQLTYYTDDPDRVGVSLDVIISDSSANSIDLSFEGDVQRKVVNADLVLLKGPLYTTVQIGGEEYDVSAGFTKVEDRDGINVGLVFTSADEQYQALYSFGPVVLTDSDYVALRNAVTNNVLLEPMVETSENASIQASANDYYDFYDDADGNLIISNIPTTASGTGSTLTVYENTYHKRFMAGVNTALYQLTANDFTSGEFVASGLYSMTVRLQRYGQAGEIDGLESINVTNTPSGSRAVMSTVFSLASSLLALVPNPYAAGASAIAGLLSNIDEDPRIYYEDFTNDAYVTLSGFDTYEQVNFDNAMLPIVFDLGSDATETVTFRGTMFLEMEYSVDLLYAAFYIPVTDVTIGVAMDI